MLENQTVETISSRAPVKGEGSENMYGAPLSVDEDMFRPCQRWQESDRNDLARESGNKRDDSSTFEIGTMCHYAPAWNGILQGIQGVGIGTTPPSDSDS